MLPFQFSVSHQKQIHKKHWTCHHCRKKLSSKRSYDEHMNIHNKQRPFACDECHYAAASQMTLRRHKLRNHVPRTDWGYQCPHCPEKYMEPASYQQHVIASHWGYSATFGCPYKECTFTTKSSRYFCDHLSKHRAVMANRIEHGQGTSSFKLNIENLALYLINDECGAGHSSSKTLRRYNVEFDKRAAIQRAVYNGCVQMISDDANGGEKVARINVETLLDSEDRQRKNAKKKTLFRPVAELTKIVYNNQNAAHTSYSYSTPPISNWETISSSDEDRTEILVPAADTAIDWIETEVVIEENTIANESSKLPDGQIDDFGLD